MSGKNDQPKQQLAPLGAKPPPLPPRTAPQNPQQAQQLKGQQLLMQRPPVGGNNIQSPNAFSDHPIMRHINSWLGGFPNRGPSGGASK